MRTTQNRKKSLVLSMKQAVSGIVTMIHFMHYYTEYTFYA